MLPRTDHIWHPYTKYSVWAGGQCPIIVRGKGPYLYDDQDNRYLDAISSWWACSLGHSHPRLVATIQKQAGILQHSILGNLSHKQGLTLAERLSSWTGGNRQIHFASDGAGAVEAAIKIAVQYWHNIGNTKKTTFASLQNPYHGDTMGAVSVGFMETFHQAFRPLAFPTHTLPPIQCDPKRCEFSPPHCTGACADQAVAMIHQQEKELAAVIVEPLCQGAAGMKMYGSGFLQRIAAACRDAGVLLITDEVAMGFYRTGTRFAFDHAGIRPDIVCVGKALSAGTLPISAAAVDRAIFETFRDHPLDNTFYHGHTFAGNPLAAAAANTALDLYEEMDLPDLVHSRSQAIQKALTSLEPIRARHLGLIMAAEVPDPQRVAKALLNSGILTRPLGNTIYLMPPFILTDEQWSELLENFVSEIKNSF